MTYLLFQWSRWDYKYLLKAPEPDCWVLFSKDYKQRVSRYLSGSIPVVRMSKKDDMTDIPYQQFMKCLCQSKMVCMPIDCESPQGLIVMFEAAANNKMILISDTPTTQEYLDDSQRMGKDVNQWRDAIRYYLSHDDERRERATAFHAFLKNECNETAFAATVKKLVGASI